MSDVTYLESHRERKPARAELKARRSRDKHMGRLNAASTPEQALEALYDRGRAILARGDGDISGAMVARLIQAMAPVFDEADRAHARVRRGRARAG